MARVGSSKRKDLADNKPRAISIFHSERIVVGVHDLEPDQIVRVEVPSGSPQGNKDVQPAAKTRSLGRIAAEAAAEEFGKVVGRTIARLLGLVPLLCLLVLLHR